MRKWDVLQTVIKNVEQEGTIQYRYAKDGCMCAIGHVMSACGVDLQPYRDNDWLNKKAIDHFLNFAMDGEYEDVRTDTFDKLLEAGFTVKELEELQGINDDISDPEERKAALLAKLNAMLDEELPF